MAQSIRKVVFPVGGMGTRFLPATKVMPKEMLVVLDKPLIQHGVEEAAAAGIDHFIFVSAHGKTMIEDHFDASPELMAALEAKGKRAEIETVEAIAPPERRFASARQPTAQGLGHAVWCARHLVGEEPFAVLLPDDLVLGAAPCLAQLTEAYERVAGNIVAVMDVPRERTDKYGILDVSEDPGTTGSLVPIEGLVEKPKPEDAPSTLSIIGRYILQPEIFDILERGEVGAGGEIQLTDALAALIGRQPVHGLRFDGVRHDCGDKAGWLGANIAMGLQDPAVRQTVEGLLADAGFARTGRG